MRNRKHLPLVIGLIALASTIPVISGCATLSQAEIKALETREIDLSYDESYQAAMNGLFALGFSIDHSDKASGILTGRRTSKVATMSVTFLLILPLPTVSEGTLDEAVTFKLAGIESRMTQLRMKLIVNGKSVVDKVTMSKIWQQVEREAMLESRPSDREPVAHATPEEVLPKSQ